MMTYGSSHSRNRWCAVGIVFAAWVPILVATVRALNRHWLPVGDNALVALRSADVFSSDFPLLGLASSASLAAGAPLNHPGPLLFDLLALPITVFGRGPGTAIGIAIINGVGLALIGWVGWRRGGLIGAALGALTAAALTWSMGSELLYDPWQPHGLLVTFLAFLFLIWAVLADDLVCLPIAVGVGSLLMQSHLTYGYVVPALLALAAVGGFIRTRRAAAGRRRAVVATVAVAVGVIAWMQPIVEEFTVDEGNVSRLVEQLRDPPTEIVGNRDAIRLTAAVVARPPFWLRGSFADTFRPAGQPIGSTAPTVDETGVPGLAWSAALLGVPILALATVGFSSWRRRNRVVGTAVVVTGAAFVLGVYTASRITTNVVGVAPHQFRFLWPIAAFVTFVAMFGAVRLLRFAPTMRLLAAGTGVVAFGWVVIANLATAIPTGGPQLEQWSIPVIADLNRQLERATLPEPLLAEWSEIRFLEPFSAAIAAQLASQGTEFVTAEPYLIRQLGPTREYDDGNAVAKIFYRDGAAARERRLGPFRRVAFHAGPSDRETVGIFVGPVSEAAP